MLRKNPIETGEKCSVYKVNQLERCAVHRDGTCSVIKPTGLPSADDIWGINLTRRQLRDLSRALLGRLSCYHTDSGNGFHCWRDIRFPKQFHSEVTLLQIHIGWHIRFCISPSFKCLLARFQFWLWSNQSRWFCGVGPIGDWEIWELCPIIWVCCWLCGRERGLEEEVHSITTLQSFAPNPQIGLLPPPNLLFLAI